MEGSLTIHDPPTPWAGIVKPPEASALHLAFFPHIALTMSRIAIVTARVHRPECDRAGNISAEYGHEIELPFGLDARLFGQVVPQVSFRQQVREERR
jgi:hypothetical protein